MNMFIDLSLCLTYAGGLPADRIDFSELSRRETESLHEFNFKKTKISTFVH